MAVKNYIIIAPDSAKPRYFIVKWLALANGDTGQPYEGAELADRSVQFVGTPGVGGTFILEGSNDGGTTYNTLTDAQGSAISKTAGALSAVTELAGLVRPRVTAGDGTTSMNVYMLCRIM
jgi:hypothetical protein